jgi:O-antigen/teichoic acid export membrane protein
VLGKVLKSDLAKQLATMVSATIIAQVVNFLLNIFLARVYTPDQFGVLSLFLSLTGFITVISCFKFDVAVVAAKTDDDARKLIALGLRINVIVSVLIILLSLVNFLLAERGLYAHEKIHDWLWFIGPASFFLTCTQLFWMWNVRSKRFNRISWVRIAEAVVNGGVALAAFSLGAWGLLSGAIASQIISVVLLFLVIRHHKELHIFRAETHEHKDVFYRYSEFPKINIIQGFVDILQLSLIVIFLQYAFTDKEAGFYGQCMRVLQVPMRLIVLPVAHVYFAEASDRYRKNGDLAGLTRKTAFQTLLLGIPVTVVLLAFGPQLFALVFGENWREAGEYARLLSVWIMFDLARAPVQQVASIVGKQRIVLVVTIIGAVLLISSLLISGYYHLSARTALLLVGITQSLVAFVLVILALRLSTIRKQ